MSKVTITLEHNPNPTDPNLDLTVDVDFHGVQHNPEQHKTHQLAGRLVDFIANNFPHRVSEVDYQKVPSENSGH